MATQQQGKGQEQEEVKAGTTASEVVEKSKRQARLEEKRKRRVSPGIPSKRLDYPARPGFVRRVVVDRPGRLEKFERGGWEYVHEQDLSSGDYPNEQVTTREGIDSRVSQVVGQHRSGEPQHGYLMEIEQELYDEDQAEKQAKIDRLEAGLRAGQVDGGSSAEDGGYVKQIKIDQRGRSR